MQDILSMATPSPTVVYNSALVFFRMTGFFLPLPIFGSQQLPARIKIILISALSILIVTHTKPIPAPEHILTMAIFSVKEFGLGLVLGYVFMCIMQVIFIAGEMVSMQMGLSFATLVDPETDINTPLIGQFYHLMMLLLLLGMNAHLALIQVFTESMTLMPLGTFSVSEHFFQDVMGLLSWMLGAGLLIALPVMLMLLMLNLATGMMSKAASQLNIFSIGLPVSLLVGLFTLGLTTPAWADHMLSLINTGMQKTTELME